MGIPNKFLKAKKETKKIINSIEYMKIKQQLTTTKKELAKYKKGFELAINNMKSPLMTLEKLTEYFLK